MDRFILGIFSFIYFFLNEKININVKKLTKF